MDEVIDKILNIDKEAEERLIKAQHDKESILKDAKLKELKIKDDNIMRADKRIGKVEQVEKENTDMKIAELNEQLTNQKQKLDGFFADNREKWEEEIINRIVGD